MAEEAVCSSLVVLWPHFRFWYIQRYTVIVLLPRSLCCTSSPLLARMPLRVLEMELIAIFNGLIVLRTLLSWRLKKRESSYSGEGDLLSTYDYLGHLRYLSTAPQRPLATTPLRHSKVTLLWSSDAISLPI